MENYLGNKLEIELKNELNKFYGFLLYFSKEDDLIIILENEENIFINISEIENFNILEEKINLETQKKVDFVNPNYEKIVKNISIIPLIDDEKIIKLFLSVKKVIRETTLNGNSLIINDLLFSYPYDIKKNLLKSETEFNNKIFLKKYEEIFGSNN